MDAPGRYKQNPPLRGEAEPPLREVEGSRSSQCNTCVFGSLPSLSEFRPSASTFPASVEHTGSSRHFFLLSNRFFFGLTVRVRLFCGVVCGGCVFYPYVCETCA
jgi:hypothetical protein